nr:MAG TPA: hypothetical protein [Caudoviricetes sp.]
MITFVVWVIIFILGKITDEWMEIQRKHEPSYYE